MKLLLGLLLRAYPPAFRARFGDEVVEQAREECAAALERGLGAGLACVLATSVDLVRSGLAERWAPTWVDQRESGREEGVGMMLSHWMRDLSLAARALRKSPGFALAAVGTLALALGANAGIFSVVDAVLLRPLPYESPDRLVYIAASAPGSDFPEEFEVSAEFYLQYRDEATQLEGLSAFTSGTATIRVDDRVERLRQAVVSPGLFELLGATPIAGRLPAADRDERAVLISHGLWTTWFGGDAQVIGRTYQFMDGPREIIGVMGPEFRFPNDGTVAWIPREVRREDVTPGRFGLPLVGRMTTDADLPSLRRELSVLAARLPELYGGSPAYARLMEQHVPVVRPLREALLGPPVSTTIWVLWGAVGVVLLIACANVASLFTVRAEGRGRDLAVRRAIGARRGALVRAQLSEAVVVATLAGALALAVAALVLPAFVAAAPDDIPRMGEVGISGGTIAFTVAASLLGALLCGLAPAVRASAPDLARLRDGARGSTRGRAWMRDALVVAQTGLALTLLVGSALLLRSFQHLQKVDPGYDTEDILTFQFAPDEAHLTDGPSWARFHVDFMDRLRALPGVERVGIVENVPLDESVRGTGFLTEASTAADAEDGSRAGVTFAGGEYFEAMGIEVLRGRGFVEDDALIPGNVVVSASAAELLWPDADALGRRLRSATFEEWHTVVGVVEDIVQDDLREDPGAMVYYPLIGPEPDSWALTSPGYVVRTARAETIAPEIRELVREVAPSAPMYRVYTMETLVSRRMAGLSFTMLTLAVAAGFALLLGAIGLYGVLSYVVAQRTQEIGVRMALGAEAARVRRMVVGEGVRVVALGIGLGIGVALLSTRALSSLLFGVAPVDPWTFAGMSLAMAAIGALASWLPARRASRVDPIRSMRGA